MAQEVYKKIKFSFRICEFCQSLYVVDMLGSMDITMQSVPCIFVIIVTHLLLFGLWHKH